MRIEIPTNYAVVGLFLAVAGLFLYAFARSNDHNRATLAFAATATAGAFALHTYLAGIDERRIANAHALIQRWNSPEMLPVRVVLREITENRLDPETLERKVKGGELLAEADQKRALYGDGPQFLRGASNRSAAQISE